MLKKENLGLYLEIAGIIGLGVMAFKTEAERYKEAMRRIKLEAENLELRRELDELTNDYMKLREDYDELLDDICCS